MEQMSLDQEIVRTTNCVIDQTKGQLDLKGHKFHQSCFKEWLEKGDLLKKDNIYTKCPLCRAELLKPEIASPDKRSTVYRESGSPNIDSPS